MSFQLHKKKFKAAFPLLSRVERQLIAFSILCSSPYNDEKKNTAVLQKAGISNEVYQSFLKNLPKLGFTKSKINSTIPDALHHDILVKMPEEDMIWVYEQARLLHQGLSGSSYEGRRNKVQGLLRIAVYANDLSLMPLDKNDLTIANLFILDLQSIFQSYAVDEAWLQSRHPLIRQSIFVALLGHYYCEHVPSENNNELVTAFLKDTEVLPTDNFLLYYYGIICLSLGELEKAKICCSTIHNAKSGFFLGLQAGIFVLENQLALALPLFRKALTAFRKETETTQFYFDNLLGLLHTVCLTFVDKQEAPLKSNASNYIKYYDANWSMPMGDVYGLFSLALMLERGQQSVAFSEWQAFRTVANRLKNPISIALDAFIGFIINQKTIEKNARLHQTFNQCQQQNHRLAMHVLSELLRRNTNYRIQADAFLETSAIRLRLFDFVDVKDAWEYSFHALEHLLLGDEPDALKKTKRLLWLVDPDRQLVDVIEQSLGKSGNWSKGRSINLARLLRYHTDSQFDYLTEQDKRALTGLIEEDEGWRGSYCYFSPYQTFLSLVGHPNVAHVGNRDVAIELVLGEPEVHIQEKADGYHVGLSHCLSEIGLIIEPESLNKYKIINFSKEFVDIGRVLTPNGLLIPMAAKDQVLHVIQRAKRDITIHVDIKDIAIPELQGNPNPCIQLLPTKDGVRATLWVRPQTEHGAYLKAAEGKETLMVLIPDADGEVRARIRRDFAAEQRNQKALLAKCPSLLRHEYDAGEYEIESPEDVLEALSELQAYATAAPLTIEWPQGQTFKIKQRVNASHLSFNITSELNWFGYDGRMTLHDGEVLTIQELLQSFDERAFGRFIRLNDGEFIELTGQLKKQLQVLQALSDNQKINVLGAQVLSDIVAQVENTTFDEGWAKHVKKIKTMRAYAPKVPSTLQATLRDYQIEGYQYLSRLNHWGIGACLADDMGLGKTVQTIALLLERAKNGPALVVAPTSVCFNWLEELYKFAPTLTAYDLRSQEREATLQAAGAFDVVVCSYGLLQHNDALLAEKTWETIVLDEAQAIKNAQTQRWKTVMKLKGRGRVALSGTPIENHLGELWSIFSFINPGLLGSVQSFQTKYSTPIESSSQANAQMPPQTSDRMHALRTLVQPYILRRIKSDVLTELPPKIEQTIHVEQTEEEATFYEAVRRTAEQRVVELMAENNRISVLAEITKLRLACCDSSLVDETFSIENSKLNALIETLQNIVENGHKALIFSQYVSFLSIVRRRIEAEKFAYQYLDGSSTPSHRKKSVAAFQAGEGDVFLLSLKAGGSGLNLTAADYVIHLDPWWNPAVEDQASDRAHRMGQERPVTIYRFVMRNTIEEKIIQLHERKRNLANELLSGHGISGKLSNDDLMNLISNSLR